MPPNNGADGGLLSRTSSPSSSKSKIFGVTELGMEDVRAVMGVGVPAEDVAVDAE